MRVLVTGAGGFIGSHVCEALRRDGAEVRAFVHYDSRGTRGHLDEVDLSIEVVAGDVRDAEQVREAVRGCDAVLHLAALIGVPYSYRAPRSYVDVNVHGTLNVLEAVRASGATLVHTSTSETYGGADGNIGEGAAPLSRSPYAASKVAADQLVVSYVHSFGLPAVILRPFNNYGPRQSARAFLPSVLTQALAGEVVRVGNLETVRDLVFVEDTARAFVAAARSEAARGRVVQIGTESGVSMGELARRAIERTGRACRLEVDPERVRPAASEVHRLVADTTLARELLGWSPAVGLDEGLDRTIEYLAANLEAYRTEVFAV